jgi:hypothetical protein
VSWKRTVRIGLTLALTGLCTAYILWKIDVGKTAHIIGSAHVGYLLLALAIMAGTIPAMAWRWRLLLRAKGIDESLRWLARTYFVSYTAGQVLPSSLGGDAVRIYEAVRRHPGKSGPVAGSIVLERVLGGAATLLLAAVGFLLAIGRYNVGVYIWIELGFVVATVALGVVLFSRRARPLLRRTVPVLKKVWIERHVRAVYEGIHSYRENPVLLCAVTAATLVIQAAGVMAIWASGEAVGIDLSPRPYFVMGPLLLLIVLIPFTVSGLAVRESFFVSFLGELSVGADDAFSAGFLFFVVTLVVALPGLLIWAVEAVRGLSPRAR